VIAAGVEILADDYEAAERELRWAYKTLEEMGDRGVRAPIAAYLADVLYAQARDEEAESFATIADELAAADDLVAQVLLRSVRAKVLARRGDLDEALRLAAEAGSLVESTDFLDLQASTLLSHAEVLEALGKSGEAEALVARADELYRKKGNLAASRRIVRKVKSNGRTA
jgi:ATP/maltotriose-dependent transcriptional regulator MalT